MDINFTYINSLPNTAGADPKDVRNCSPSPHGCLAILLCHGKGGASIEYSQSVFLLQVLSLRLGQAC